jgi:hypothetical protein
MPPIATLPASIYSPAEISFDETERMTRLRRQKNRCALSAFDDRAPRLGRSVKNNLP